MLVAVYCIDKDDMLATRLEVRPAHLQFLSEMGSRMKLAGPLMDEAGEQPVGSLLIISADSVAQAADLMSADPYRAAGLFKSVDLRPWRGVLGEWWEDD